MASSLVPVNDALVRNDVDGLDRRLVDFRGLGLVAGVDSLANCLDGGTELRAQCRVMRVCFSALTGALAGLCSICHDGSLSCSSYVFQRFPFCFWIRSNSMPVRFHTR